MRYGNPYSNNIPSYSLFFILFSLNFFSFIFIFYFSFLFLFYLSYILFLNYIFILFIFFIFSILSISIPYTLHSILYYTLYSIMFYLVKNRVCLFIKYLLIKSPNCPMGKRKDLWEVKNPSSKDVVKSEPPAH